MAAEAFIRLYPATAYDERTYWGAGADFARGEDEGVTTRNAGEVLNKLFKLNVLLFEKLLWSHNCAITKVEVFFVSSYNVISIGINS